MERQVIDVYLDEDGKVISNPVYAIELRRTVIEDGRVVERSVAYRKITDRPKVEAYSVKPQPVTKGDFEGHPFRGNQWTTGEGGAREEEVSDSRPAEEIKRDYEAQKAKHSELVAKENDLRQKTADLIKQQNDALSDLRAARATANRDCGVAWSNLAGYMTEHAPLEVARSPLPEMEKWATANGDTAALDRINEYRRTQQASEEADAAKTRAEMAWAREHPELGRVVEERNEIARQRYMAEEGLSNLRREAAGLARAVDQEKRTTQTAAEAREPRETPATAIDPLDPETSKRLDAMMASGKPGYFNGTHYVAASWTSDAERESSAIKLEPNFKATIKSATDFKAKMAKMYPGMEIEGVPRKADLHILTMIHDEMGTLRDEFPEVAVRTLKLNAGGMRATAWSGSDKITFGKQGVEDFGRAHAAFGTNKRRESPDEKPDFHDGMRTYSAVARHEFGHQMHYQHPEVQKRFNDYLKGVPPEQRTRVTGYALKNRSEFFAETFAAIKYGDRGTKAHPAVKELDKILKDYFRELRRRRKQ